MPKVSPLQSSFASGEFSPLMKGRVDLDRYKAALETCVNFLPTVQGGLTRRPGTKYVAQTRYSGTTPSRLVRFEYSTTQAYILEFGDLYIRFYKDNAQIESSPGTAYQIVTGYADEDLFQLKFTQSADVLYITHPAYKPAKLTRTGHTSWTLTDIDFQDGPYLPINPTYTTAGLTVTTLTPSATSGSIGVTASAVAGINDGTGFQTSDVGRLIRLKDAAGNWTWAKITSRSSTTVVQAAVMGPALSSTAAVSVWRLGAWSFIPGYPACSTFHEGRLFFGGAPFRNQRFDGSCVDDYENFSPSLADGTLSDSKALSFTLDSDDVNAIRWMKSEEKGLLVGTVAGPWVVRPSSQGEALTPITTTAKPAGRFKTANIDPVRAGKATIFVQASGRKVRELIYYYEVDGFKAPDLTQLAEHVTESGIVDMAYQDDPQGIVWCVRADGVLAAMTYEREAEGVQVAWHRHILGGSGDSEGNHALVESVAVIPSSDGTTTEVWMIVKRYLFGQTKRYVEYLTPIFDDTIEQEDAFFVDCGLTYEGSSTSTITGLDHLPSETVAVLADGAVQTSKTVSSNQISLDYPASKVHVGYSYNSDAKLLPLEAGAADGTALGKTRRTHRVGIMLHRSLGLKVGYSFDDLTSLEFRTAGNNMDEAIPLFTGIVSETVDADYDFENSFCIRQDQPLPTTILAIAPQMVTQDRG